MQRNSVKKILGIAALLLLTLSLNLLVWTQAFFSAAVLAPLALAALTGLGWLIMALLTLAEHSALEDRTLGSLNAVFASTVFLGVCVMMYLLAGAWDVSWDLTEEGRRDLSPQTLQVLQAMNTEVEATCFFLQSDEELVAIARDKTMRFLEQCQKYTPLLKVEQLDPTIDRARLEAMNITHASVQGTIVLRSGERQRVITLSGGSPRLEERDFTNALINVLRKTEPKVYFLTGHKERDIMDEDEQNGGSTLGNLLKGESYLVDRLAIKISEPIPPADADIVVINNPTMDLHPVEIEALNTFIEGGGRLVLFINPWRSTGTGYAQGEQLRPYIEKKFGISIGNDIVITDQGANIWQAELAVDDVPFQTVEEEAMTYRGAFSLKHPITRNFDQTMMLQAMRSVTISKDKPEGASVIELLRTTPDFWAETDTAKLLETGQAKWDDGERRGPIPLAAAAVLPVNKEKSPRGYSDARVIVVGDADFVSNANVIIPGHINFLLNTFAWLSESEDLIAMRPTGKETQPLILSAAQQRTIAWIAIMFTVQITIAAGLAVYVVRRTRK